MSKKNKRYWAEKVEQLPLIVKLLVITVLLPILVIATIGLLYKSVIDQPFETMPCSAGESTVRSEACTTQVTAGNTDSRGSNFSPAISSIPFRSSSLYPSPAAITVSFFMMHSLSGMPSLRLSAQHLNPSHVNTSLFDGLQHVTCVRS